MPDELDHNLQPGPRPAGTGTAAARAGCGAAGHGGHGGHGNLRLRARGDAIPSQRILLLPDVPEVVIGRDQRCCQIVLVNSTVSAVHAKVTLATTGARNLTDEGSRNGTFLNGRQVTQPTAVRAGDVVRFGKVEYDVELAPAQTWAETR